MCLKRISPSLGFRRIVQLFNKHFVSRDESTKDLVKSLLRLNQKKRLSLDKVPRRYLKPPLETTALVPPSHKSSTPGIRAISDTSISWKVYENVISIADLCYLCSSATLHRPRSGCNNTYVLIWIFFVASHPSMAFRLIECFYGLAPGAEVLSHPWFTVQNLRTRQLSGQVARRVLRLADTAIAIIYMENIPHTQRMKMELW